MPDDLTPERLRRPLILVMLVVLAISGPVGTYIQYRTSQATLHHSQEALRDSQRALRRARENRQVVQFKLCQGQNQLRRANNRDHGTFKNAVQQQTHALKVITDPVLHGLVVNGLKRSRLELQARPLLPIVKCKKLIGIPQPK